MLKRLLLPMIFIISIILIGCSNESIQSIEENTVEEIDISDREYITDEGLDELIKNFYNISNLEKYEVYRIEDEMNIHFYFDENAERADIMASRDLMTRVFIRKYSSVISGPSPNTLFSLEDWKKVNYRVYIEKSKVVEQKVLRNKSAILSNEYYENGDIDLISRQVETKEMKEFKESIKRKYWWSIKDITFEKSFKGNVLLVKIKGRAFLKDKKVEYIKKAIEDELALKLEENTTKTFGSNIDYLGIVLQLYNKDKKYYEETYYNGEEKHWFKDEWSNYKYFDRYLKKKIN